MSATFVSCNLTEFVTFFCKVNERKEKELKDSKNEMRKIQDLSQETLQKMRIERDAKNQECEELRMQVDLYFYRLCRFSRV